MPLIMEEGLDVDDLFGDPNSLDLGLPASQPTKGLAQRLDEMRLWGCCKWVALPSIYALCILCLLLLTER
jgi:mediator of RNA polymerase II transcription subunit 16, fungi type